MLLDQKKYEERHCWLHCYQILAQNLKSCQKWLNAATRYELLLDQTKVRRKAKNGSVVNAAEIAEEHGYHFGFDDYALDHIEDKVLPFSCVQRRKSTKGYTTHCNWAR